MNYLAHLYYAGDCEESIVGNYLGDFVKGRLDKTQFSEKITQGIALHRKLDKLADDNIISLMNSANVDFQHRRYAGITFDLACDHFLSKYWHEFHLNSLIDFSDQRINILESNREHLPEKGKLVLDRMVEYKWLENYHDLRFLEQVFKGIHKRFPKENKINEAFMDIENNYSALELSCLEFLKQLASGNQTQSITST
jgi:acyl carrier protein phosphodiesterase